MKVTFLGLGIMGSRMAKNILTKSNFELTVWNRSLGPREELAAAGARVQSSPRAAVAEADLVITMLANPEVVAEVMFARGTLDQMKQNAIWADSSTVSPSFARRCNERAAAAGIRYLGTPVAGTRQPAEAGTLKVLVGGPAATLEVARPVLEAYSAGIVHIGEDADRGAAYKILVNGMLAQSMLVFSETVKLGVAMGLDQDFLLKNLAGLPVIAPFVAGKTDLMRSGDYSDVSFPLELMHKDLHLVVQMAYEVGQPTPIASLSREEYGRVVREGRGREDFSAIFG